MPAVAVYRAVGSELAEFARVSIDEFLDLDEPFPVRLRAASLVSRNWLRVAIRSLYVAVGLRP